MKTIQITFLLLFISISGYSQMGADTVTLITEGSGITNDAAVNSALRGAIEQAFGTFISSKTEILNDSLISDKIISVSNGNIKSYKILSSINLKNDFLKVTVQSTVSINSLQSFCKNSGVISEYQGGMFARNLAIQELNEKNEFVALLNITETTKELSNNIWDYKLEVKSPVVIFDKWNIPITVEILPNKNIDLMQNYLINSLLGLSMNLEQVKTYEDLNKPVYKFMMYTDTINKDNRASYLIDNLSEMPVINKYDIYLRNKKSLSLLHDMLYYLQYSHGNFMILDGIDSINIVKSSMVTYFQNQDPLRREADVKREASDFWSFFPVGGSIQANRISGGEYSGEPYWYYKAYNNKNRADNYKIQKLLFIRTFENIKFDSKSNKSLPKEYFIDQMSIFADSSKCFCSKFEDRIREVKNLDSFKAGMESSENDISLMMRINSYNYFKNILRAKISIDKIVTKEHLSKIQNIEVIPITIIDKTF